jgi:hypothetical protein
MPGALFSGRKRVPKGIRGIFFCFGLPALDNEKDEFTTEAGTTRWYLYNMEPEQILEDPPSRFGTKKQSKLRPSFPSALRSSRERSATGLCPR